MNAKFLCAILLLPSLAFSAGPSHGKSRNERPLAPNPSAYVAADIGFSRLVQDKGQAAAIKEFADQQAVILTPQQSPQAQGAREWAKAQGSGAMRWQPHSVMISCDGNIGVTQGNWQSADQSGRYVTVWQRDAKGRLSWRAHQRTALDVSPDAPEFISTRQASCNPRAPVAETATAAPAEAKPRRDHSLLWSVMQDGEGASALDVRLWNGSAMEAVLPSKQAAVEANEGAGQS